MNAKDKAEELVNKFGGKTGTYQNKLVKRIPKQCALICVEEIIESSPSLPLQADNGTYGSDIEENAIYWQQVKTEIEKL